MNTWPGGIRKALSPDEHERWNSSQYPGTRQVCACCEEPTGNCEDDSLYNDEGLAVCQDCFKKAIDKGCRLG